MPGDSVILNDACNMFFRALACASKSAKIPPNATFMKLSHSLLCSAFVYAVSCMLTPAVYAESYSNLPLGPTIYVNPAEVTGDTFQEIVSTENGGAVRVTE